MNDVFNFVKATTEAISKNTELMTNIALANVNVTKVVTKTTEANIINTKTTNKSVNMISFAMENFKTAPPLKKLEYEEIIKSIRYLKRGLKIIEYDKQTNTESNNDSDYDDNNFDINSDVDILDPVDYTVENIMEYAEIIISHYNNKTLRDFVGEIIKHCRHKKNPNDNSFWETDIQRLHFIVKYESPTYDKSIWIKDECGTIIKDVVIINLCDNIKKILSEYVKEVTKCDDQHTKKKTTSLKISKMIGTDNFHIKVLKYIAPNFRFNDVMMKDFEENDNENKDIEKHNEFIYNTLYDVLKNTNIKVCDNYFVSIKFEGQENVVNSLIVHKNIVICVYYKYHKNKISLQEITNIRKASCTIFGENTDDFFKKSISKTIPIVIYNGQLSDDEMGLLLKNKVKFVSCLKSMIKPYVFNLFGIEDDERLIKKPKH